MLGPCLCRPVRAALPALLALAGLLRPASPRPLPDKNELANACYFTYQVGFVICDEGLGPAEAEREMEAGRCNRDFRLMASDFQRRVVHHYSAGAAPPLEEAMWLLTSPENFQSRTLRECPAMQVLALLLIAEAKLQLNGPGLDSPAGQLVREAVQQAGQVPADVYSALAKAWPMEVAIQRFQDTVNGLRSLVKQRSAPESFQVHVVFCRCTESLEWFSDLAKLASAAPALDVFSYNSCEGHASASAAGGPTLDAAAFRSLRETPAAADVAGARSECSARGVVAHFLGSALAETSPVADKPPAFTLVLGAAEPEGPERQLLEMVLRSLARRTLDVGFLPLGMRRLALHAPSACDLALWRGALGTGLPCGYEGARFLVGGGLLQASAQRLERLQALLDSPPAACAGADADQRLSAAWHVAFGKDAWLPLRAEDEALPLFLRFADGPSGFQGTRMPKTSSYLASVEAGGGAATAA